LEKLLETLMRIVIVSAGADKAFLILQENDKPYVYAQVFLNQAYTPLTTPVPLAQMNENVCIAIIKYVMRTKTKLLLNNAPDEGNFRYDPYILSKAPQSILCIPLIQKDSLTGILYLENTPAKNAFTPQRTQLLTLLSSQIAISIQNAQFYNKLETKVQDRTQELQKTNQELQQAIDTIKKVQQQMIQQEKMASLGLLTSGIAHELRNPLNFVLNFSEVAREDLKELISTLLKLGIKHEDIDVLIQAIKESLEKVDIHGKRADGIIKGMLVHAYQGSTKIQSVDLNANLEEALKLIQESFLKKGPSFKPVIQRKLNPHLEPIEGVIGDLIRVFINIFDNAFYALLEKATAHPTDFTPTLEIKTEKRGNQVVVSIRDNGPGINKESLANIFQPFFTTKPAGSGTGLGLSIVYDIITKEHGGTIEVQSELNTFTEFVIKLPLRSEKK
jgi:signal transduction histidine kinase